MLNTFNNDEKARLEALRDKIDKMINGIEQAIIENNQKVANYRRELVASTPENIPTTAGKGGVILVHSDEE